MVARKKRQSNPADSLPDWVRSFESADWGAGDVPDRLIRWDAAASGWARDAGLIKSDFSLWVWLYHHRRNTRLEIFRAEKVKK